jgi:uncharacterized protein (DUF2267 family)
MVNNGGTPVDTDSTSIAVAGSTGRRRYIRHRPLRRFSAGRVVWVGLLRLMQRAVHYKHGDRLEFKLNFSVRDLLAEKSRAVRDQFEALVAAVQKAGSYPAREEAARAMHAVMDSLKEKVPPDVFSRLAESLKLQEAARLGRAAAGRLQKDGGKEPTGTSSPAEPKTAAKPGPKNPADAL